MTKDAINPIFIITLAIIPLLSVASTLNEVVFLGLIVGLTYIIAISIVSALESLVDRNLRFFVFILIACAIITVLNYIYSTFPNSLYTDAGSKINYCLISASILSLQIIYYNSKKELTHYFYKLLVQVPSFLGMYFVFGFLREIIAYGSIWNANLGFSGLDFFKSTPGAMLLLAFMCAFVNAYWLNISRKRQQYVLLVEKYKMKINMTRNQARIDKVNQSEVDNFGVSELIDDDFVPLQNKPEKTQKDDKGSGSSE